MHARLYLLVLTTSLGACAPGAPEHPVHYWDVSAIPSRGPAIVDLETRGVGGKPYAISVSRAQVEQLRRVTEKLSALAGVPVPRLLLCDARGWTGMAGPGADGRPTIVVTVPLLHVFDEDEAAVATVIGHELGHLALNHPSAQSLDVTQIDVTPFSYKQELEADEYGARLAKKAGYDLGGMERFFRKMQAAKPNLIYVDTYHPPPEDRIANMRRIAKELEAAQ